MWDFSWVNTDEPNSPAAIAHITPTQCLGKPENKLKAPGEVIQCNTGACWLTSQLGLVITDSIKLDETIPTGWICEKRSKAKVSHTRQVENRASSA